MSYYFPCRQPDVISSSHTVKPMLKEVDILGWKDFQKRRGATLTFVIFLQGGSVSTSGNQLGRPGRYKQTSGNIECLNSWERIDFR